jgi:diguanylate cyclase (GGDEF)-like protein
MNPSSTLVKAKSFRSRWSGVSYFVPAILAVAAVIAGVVSADLAERARHMAGQRLSAAEQLGQVTSSIETNIHGSLNLVHGLVAAIAANPTITQPQFDDLSERIFAVSSQLRNVAAAPGFVVRYVYPAQANRSIVGLDYRVDPVRHASVMDAVQKRALVVTGPVGLKQGGTGLIARYPVFALADGRFWGVVSAVIGLEALYLDSDIGTPEQPLQIAISQRPSPEADDVFLGDYGLFAQEPVRASVELGYDTWYLAAVPKGGWQAVPPHMVSFRIYALLIAFCIVAPLIWAGWLMQQRQRYIVTLQQREEQLEALSQRLGLALDASEIGVWEYEPSTDSFLWDRRMSELYGLSDSRFIHSYADWRKTIHPDDLAFADQPMHEAFAGERHYLTQYRIVTPAGDIRHIRAHGAVHRTPAGTQRLVGASWDVSEDVALHTELQDARTRAEAQNDQLRAARRTLEHQSLHDALTGLPNRRFLDQFMEAAQTMDKANRLAFIHFDLDRFKEVNDTLSHAAGDEVLKVVTGRVLKLISHDEFVARIGGDEFVAVTSGEAPEERARELADEIIKSLAKPILFDSRECHVGCSAGIAYQSACAEQPRQLLINADVALYEAKKRGRNRTEEFSQALLLATIHLRRTSDELLTALENDQIVPFFQPQFDARTMAIAGVEALARWHHPTRGLLRPDTFLGIADSLHRSAEIDAIMLEKALQQASRWRALGLDVPKLSVNISAQRLKDDRLMKRLSSLAFVPGTLSFELLESISFDGQDQGLRDAILHLKTMGIDIEIDDFGTGHASIVSLIELGPKRLKIDRKLIAPLQAAGSQHRLVASIIEIGHSQGIEIVAEGVETMAQAAILRSLGCQALQGYAFARPLSANDFVAFARQWQDAHPVGTGPGVAQAV